MEPLFDPRLPYHSLRQPVLGDAVVATSQPLAARAGMRMLELGHRRYAVLQGGMARWRAEKRPMDMILPAVAPSRYPEGSKDNFTVDYQQVLQAVQDKKAVILDVRPTAYYTGKKTDEARAGYIPGAINRPYTEDVVKTGQEVRIKPVS
ncbi:MAG: hypothetical protein P8X49_14460, partial [Syntrophobacterales bacterium]